MPGKRSSEALERVLGSVKPATDTEAFKAIARAAWEEHVEREIRELVPEAFGATLRGCGNRAEAARSGDVGQTE
jgi:hypothetical protein